eukprot:6210859-Pleurochrysis_carterae.AAC.2
MHTRSARSQIASVCSTSAQRLVQVHASATSVRAFASCDATCTSASSFRSSSDDVGGRGADSVGTSADADGATGSAMPTVAMLAMLAVVLAALKAAVFVVALATELLVQISSARCT